ncbi:MAG: peptidylprolyl isomerase [Casimicrobiaceae bacterium]
MTGTRYLAAALCALLLFLSGTAPAQAPSAASSGAPTAVQHSPDEVLAENPVARLTRADYDADVQRVPAESRNAFASDPKRIGTYLNNLLLTKSLAVEGRKAGVDKDPVLQRRIGLEADRLIADAQIKRIEEAAGADFDARAAEFMLKAKEIYLVDKDKFREPGQVEASHILFETQKRTPEQALALAQETRKKLLAGADFAALAKELSDDPSAKVNGGELGWFARGRMDPAFTDAAFALKNAGDVSEPVLSRYGYHLIRLEGQRAPEQRPFEAVQDKIMADLRTRYMQEQRDMKISAIRNDPNMKVNLPAIDALVYRPDPTQFRQGRAVPRK